MKKAICFALIVSLCAAMLTGCGSASSSMPAAPPAVSDGDKVLRVASECQSVPYCWTQTDDSSGALPLTGSDEYTYGFDVEIMKRVCELAGYEIEAYKIDWDGLLLGVQSGTYDCGISGIGISEERKASMDFTDPYYIVDVVALTRRDSAYAGAKTLSDLSGAKCTSMLNTSWYPACSQIPDADIQPALENFPAMMVAVNSGAVDLVLTDTPMAMCAMLSNPDLVMVRCDPSDTFQLSSVDTDLGIAVAKGNRQIVEDLNAALAQISDDEREAIMEHAVSVQPLSGHTEQ